MNPELLKLYRLLLLEGAKVDSIGNPQPNVYVIRLYKWVDNSKVRNELTQFYFYSQSETITLEPTK